jgi:phosphatidyl-myo-inositol alpha-mannosyltransferase
MTKNHQPTITLAIPAYNEQENIKNLLSDVISQKLTKLTITSILIYLDGCTDGTEKEALSIKDKRIIIIKGQNRQGLATALNTLFSKASSEILVVLNADTRIVDKQFIEKISSPIAFDNIDLTSSRLSNFSDNNRIQSALRFSMDLKESIFSHLRAGDNVYTCHGPARAFSKKFYKSLHIKHSAGEDMYSYLYAKHEGYSYQYISTAEIYYQLPNNLTDHFRQSGRYSLSKKNMTREFDEKFVSDQFQIPVLLTLNHFVKAFGKRPIDSIIYLTLFLFSAVQGSFTGVSQVNTWTVAGSSKKIIIPEKSRKVIISNYDDINNPFYGGGGAISIHEIFKRLTKFYSLTVITGKYPGCKHRETIDGVSYLRIGLEINNPQLSQIVFQLLLPLQVFFQKYDLWIESFTPPFSTNFLQLFSSKPVLGLVHMLAAEDMERKYMVPIFKPIQNLGIKSYRYFLTTTDELAKQIRLINSPAKIFVVSNGINISNKKTLDSESKNIIFLGRLEIDQKGLDLLIEAYSYIKDKTEYNLLIAGNGSKSQLKSLSSMIKSFGLESRVTLLGQVSGKTKNELFNMANLVVIPSRFETFSMVAIEAMSYSLPLVAFDISGLKWIPNGAVIKVKKYDSRGLSNAILKIIKSPKTAKKMGQVGKRYSDHYSWENISKQYQNVISTILN